MFTDEKIEMQICRSLTSPKLASPRAPQEIVGDQGGTRVAGFVSRFTGARIDEWERRILLAAEG